MAGDASDRQQLAVLDLASELAELDDRAELVSRAVTRIRDLVPCEVASLFTLDLRDRSGSVVSAPAVAQFTGPTARVAERMDDNPLIQNAARHHDLAPRRVSDLLSAASWRRTSTFNEIVRPMGTPHLLAFPVRLGGHVVEGYALARSGRDFSDRERDVAAAAQVALVVLHRRIAGVAPTPHPARPAAGLTRRETQVLLLLAEGLTAHAIGRRLDISALTVRKHLERVYRKLGAGDRLTAVNEARARGLL